MKVLHKSKSYMDMTKNIPKRKEKQKNEWLAKTTRMEEF